MPAYVDRAFIPHLARLSHLLAERGISADIISSYRSIARQRTLYNAFLRGRSSVPVAPPGRSYHNWGLAIDIRTNRRADYTTIGALAESIGLRWGGRFRDPAHIDTGNRPNSGGVAAD